MSYILDALRRADAERARERGEVPGLNAQAFELDDEEGGARPLSGRGPRPWRAIAAGGAVVAVAIAIWLAVGRGGTASPAVPIAMAPVTAARPGQPGGTVTAPLAQGAAPAPKPAPAPTPPAADPARAAHGPAAATAVAKPKAALPRAAEAAVDPVPAAVEPRVERVADLPEGVRRDLPRLTLGGAMYSDKPASRMLVINGQVFHEGDTVAPDLSLKQIRLKEAVLEFRGHRYEVTY